MSDDQVKQPLYETLRQHEFLRDVDDEHVRKLAQIGEFVEFPEGTVIFNDGEPAVNCYLIVEGRVVLEICDSAVGCTQLQTVEDGELLGWSTLLGRKELTSTARALKATRAIELSGPRILSLCQQSSDFGYQFMRSTARTLAKRLTACRLQLIDLYSQGDADQ